MNALFLALKALDHHTFERLTVDLLKARNLDVDIKHVEGAAGDEGLDVISGQLDEQPTIWQCKSFPGGVKQSQRQQIKKSLNRALGYCTPKRWILCLSVDMDATAHRWFQRLAKSHTNATEIKLWQAADIVHHLLYYSTVRELYFPHTILDMTKLREIAAKTDGLTMSELSMLSRENTQLYLNRLRELDPRFAYEVIQTRDRIPSDSVNIGQIVTVTSGSNVVNVYPRDHEALQMKPPGGQLRFAGAGIEKMKDYIQTGMPQTFDSTELVGFTSDFDHLLPPASEQTGRTLSIRPSSDAKPSIPCRVTFGAESDGVVIEYILFTRTFAGTDQLTFESSGRLPFQITLTIRRGGSGTLKLTDTGVGHSVHEIQRYLQAITKGFLSGAVEFYDLNALKKFASIKISSESPDWLPEYTALIDCATRVANEYEIQLTMPATLAADDKRNLSLLLCYADGCQIESSEISLGLTKTREDVRVAASVLSEECSYYIVTSGENLVVFETHVSTGPIEYVIDRASVKNVVELRNHFERSPLGATADMILAPAGPMTARRHQDRNAQSIIRFQRLSATEPIENPK